MISSGLVKSVYAQCIISLSRTSSHDPWVSNICLPPPWLSYFSGTVSSRYWLLDNYRHKEPYIFIPFMKLYDLSYSYFLIFVKFQRVFEVSKSRNLLVAVGLNQGTSVLDPRLLHNHFDFFSLFFSLVCRLIHPYRLSDDTSVWYNWDISLEHSGRTRWRGFSLCPHYTVSFGFCQAVPPAWPRASWTVPFRSVCRPYQEQSKARLNALSEAAHGKTNQDSLC